MSLLMGKEEFSSELRAALTEHVTLSHPIFQELFSEGRNLVLLKMLTIEGYQITRNFLDYIENLYFRCPLPEHKRRLLFNLFEEETGNLSKTDNHVTLMQDFVRAQGISDEERDAHVPSDATRELIDYRMRGVKTDGLYHIGAAAVMIASEGQSLETSASGEPRHAMLQQVYGFTDHDTRFFSVHQKEDVTHVRDGIALVVDLCTTEKMQQEALHAVRHTCELFRGMYDSVARRYWEQKANGPVAATACC